MRLILAYGAVSLAAVGQSRPQFDVASVKPCAANAARARNGGTTGRGSVAYHCQTLLDYVRAAYGSWGNGGGRSSVGPFNIVGGPAWINSDRFAITAKAEGSPSAGTTAGPMMQALLEDRFHLKIRRETREVPIYVLVRTKGGLKLPAAKVACWTPDVDRPFKPFKEGQPPPERCGWGQRTKDGVEVRGSTMTEFCTALTHLPLQWERRKIVDQTGVGGKFDFELKFSEEDDGPAEGARLANDDFSRLQGALLRVGLQLSAAKGPDEFIVIERAERPASN